MKKQKIFFIYFWSLSSIVFSIALIRSIIMGITCDEAMTYNVFILNTNHYQYISTIANNHILNTLLVKILDVVFNIKYNEFIMRIPNLIFYIVYIVGVFKLSKFYKNKFTISTILLLNYGLNEFFSISRGYGIASGFVILGIYFYKKYLQENSFKDFKIAISVFLFACMANTIVLILLIAILLDFIIRILKTKDFSIIFKNKLFFFITGICFLLLFIYQIFIMKADNYLISCSGNFFSCLIHYPLNYFGLSQIQSIIIYIIFIFSFLFVYIESSHTIFKKSIFNIFILVLLLFFLLGILKVNCPTTRSLTPFFPLYIIGFFDVVSFIKNNILKYIICITLIAISYVSFFSNVHLDYIREWEHDRSVKQEIEERYKNNKSIYLEDLTDIRNVAANYYYNKYYYYKKNK